MRVICRVVSGGQTGVDRAALDVARQLGLPRGGWCPRGRRTEDGTIAPTYPLQETPSEDYTQRTEWNVRDSDGTLVLTRGRPVGGTAFTIVVARRLSKPLLVLDLLQDPDPAAVARWVDAAHVATLNVAGPRESQQPGIHAQAQRFLTRALQAAVPDL